MSLEERAKTAKDAPEPQTQPDGQYKLIIRAAKKGESGEESKNPGAKYTRISFAFAKPINVPAQMVSTIFMDKIELYDEDTQSMMNLDLKHFMQAFKLTPTDLAEANFPKLLGKEGWAKVKEKDGDRGIQNEISDFITV